MELPLNITFGAPMFDRLPIISQTSLWTSFLYNKGLMFRCFWKEKRRNIIGICDLQKSQQWLTRKSALAPRFTHPNKLIFSPFLLHIVLYKNRGTVLKLLLLLIEIKTNHVTKIINTIQYNTIQSTISCCNMCSHCCCHVSIIVVKIPLG